jgi:hypothetical protein
MAAALGKYASRHTHRFCWITPTNRANSAAPPARSGSAPDRLRPQPIGLAAGNDVDVKQRRHVAERGDVNLVASRRFFARKPGERARQTMRMSE